jgi:hypothetical protein
MCGAGLRQAHLYRCWQKQNEKGETTETKHGPYTFARPTAVVGRTRQLPLGKITLCCPPVYRRTIDLGARLRGVFLQHGVKRFDEEIGIRFGENQRRAQLDNVVVRAIGPRKDAAFTKAIDHIGGL